MFQMVRLGLTLIPLSLDFPIKSEEAVAVTLPSSVASQFVKLEVAFVEGSRHSSIKKVKYTRK